jgi:hypothetical protein
MRIIDKGFSHLQFEQIMFVRAPPSECDIEAPRHMEALYVTRFPLVGVYFVYSKCILAPEPLLITLIDAGFT